MRYGLPLPLRKQKFNELLAHKQANMITKWDVPTVNGNELHEVYKVSVELPKYRLDNTRTLAMQEQYVFDKGLPDHFFADVESDQVQEIQHGFLKKLAESADKDKDLMNYFSVNTQTEPLILTNDGFVISGNRRLSTFRELVEKDYEKYRHFSEIRVVILPSLDADKIDQIEDFLEQQKDIKESFSWVARAMGYRRRMQKFKYSTDQLAAISGQKKTEINGLIDKLEIADRYLQSIGKPKDYNQIEDDFSAFDKMHSCMKDTSTGASRKKAFEKMAFIAIKNKNSFSDRMYKNIPIIHEAQAAIQEELREEFELEVAAIEQELQKTTSTVPGLPLFSDPTISIIRLMDNPAHEEKIVEIVSDKIEEHLALERDKKKKSSVFEKIKKANTLLIEANTVKSTQTDKKGIAQQLTNMERELEKLQTWLHS